MCPLRTYEIRNFVITVICMLFVCEIISGALVVCQDGHGRILGRNGGYVWSTGTVNIKIIIYPIENVFQLSNKPIFDKIYGHFISQ